MSVAGRCARHPDVEASRVCDRCGDYYCRACADAAHPGVCARCAERLPHGIAWEDPRAGRWPVRLLKTFRDVLWRPGVAFPGPARPLPALGFATICGMTFATLLLIFGVVLGAEGDPSFALVMSYEPTALALAAALGYLLFTGGIVLVALAESASFALGLLMAGRSRGLWRFAIRASGYAQGLVPLLVLPPYALNLVYLFAPSGGLSLAIRYAWVAVLFAWPVASGRVWYEAGRGLGLRSGRAAIAAAGPTLLCTLPAAYLSHLVATTS